MPMGRRPEAGRSEEGRGIRRMCRHEAAQGPGPQARALVIFCRRQGTHMIPYITSRILDPPCTLQRGGDGGDGGTAGPPGLRSASAWWVVPPAGSSPTAPLHRAAPRPRSGPGVRCMPCVPIYWPYRRGEVCRVRPRGPETRRRDSRGARLRSLDDISFSHASARVVDRTCAPSCTIYCTQDRARGGGRGRSRMDTMVDVLWPVRCTGCGAPERPGDWRVDACCTSDQALSQPLYTVVHCSVFTRSSWSSLTTLTGLTTRLAVARPRRTRTLLEVTIQM